MSISPLHAVQQSAPAPGRVASRKILHVAAPASYGGLERVIHALAVSQRERGIDAAVALLVETGAPLPNLVAELRHDLVPVYILATPPRSYLKQWRALRHLLATEQPDVVHSHGYVSDVLNGVTRLPGQARVVTVHGFTGGDLKNRAYEWMQCRALRSFDAVVAVSRRLADDLSSRGVPALNTVVVQNGASPRCAFLSPAGARDALGIPPDVFSVGWVGRLSREKGLDVMIDALPALRDVPLRLTVVGSGAERERLSARAAALGVTRAVHWAGAIPQAGRLMTAFDLLVNSSRTEGTPITLLEAMAAHVPIVATAVGGVPDLLTAADAILVPPERHDQLATAVRRVHEDRPAARARARRAGARLQDDFSAGPWVSAYEGVYTRAQQTAASANG